MVRIKRPPFIYYIAQLLLEEIEEDRERKRDRRARDRLATSEGLRSALLSELEGFGLRDELVERTKAPASPKRKASAYNKRYAKAFKKCMAKHKKKNGQWKKNGFKKCAAEARRMAKK